MGKEIRGGESAMEWKRRREEEVSGWMPDEVDMLKKVFRDIGWRGRGKNGGSALSWWRRLIGLGKKGFCGKKMEWNGES